MKKFGHFSVLVSVCQTKTLKHGGQGDKRAGVYL